ncbi:unnamed protein product [Schistocephalus solidus]|uniref:HECT domain-containing protein n=1 Tax=Schistocephalus solidus TaxID=70667 RepID=A0A183T099_SCHSO|nr:unnamed protein product [Schistocephalus solidus]
MKNILVRVDNSKFGHDAYGALCRLLLSSHFFNHLVWLLETGFGSVSKPKPDSESGVPIHFLLSACIPATLRCLQALISTPPTLLLIASNADLTSNLLKVLLATESSDLLEPTLLVKRELMGLELATKLEALRWVDNLIDITRQKGVAGLQAYIHLRLNEESSQTEDAQRDGLYDALFGLARLFVSSCSTRCQKDKISPPISLAPWAAQVVASEEYFLPCLMLLEAFHNYHASPSTDHANTVNESDARDGDQVKAATGSLLDTPGKSSEAAPSTTGRRGGQRRTFLSRLGLSAELDLPTLLTTVCMGVVRYAEGVNYLEHFGPRLLQFLPPTSWEDSLTSLTPAVVFSHLRRFSDAAAPWFYWLREAPHAIFYSEFSFGSEEAFGWLADQLQSLCEDLDKSLDSAVSQNLTEDLVGTSDGTAAAPVALHSLPPAVLLLLRFLKGHMHLPSAAVDPQLPPQPVPEVIPKSLPALTTQLLVIELYSRNGLSLLSSLVERISDYLVVVSDAFGEGATPPSDIDLLVEILVLAVELLGALLSTLKKVVGGEFHDTTPVAGLCKAFAAVIYLDQSIRSPYLISRLRSGVLTALSAYAILGQDEVSLEGSSKNLWCKVCREIFSFTVSSPEFFLPGLTLLVDLLPLPLPYETLFEPSPSDLKNLQASRIWWSRLLLRLPVELCGLLELLSPSPRNGPVFLTLRSLVDRVANLGAPLASMLASNAVDILLDLFWSAQLADKTKEQTTAPREDSSGDTINDPAQAASGSGSEMNELSAPGCLLTAGAKLVLGTPFTPPTHESGNVSPPPPPPPPAVVETSTMHHSTAQSTDDWQAHLRPFGDICEPSDVGRALCLLFVLLNQSECKQAFLDLLHESSQPTPNCGSSSTPSRGPRLLSVFTNILESCTESKAHITTQSLLIDCIGALLDHKLGVPPVLQPSASGDEIQNWECANHLPNAQFLESLTGLLLAYLDHPDRDLSALPHVLQILQRLCSHDHGFTLLQKHLSSSKHSLVFANLIGRVNDSFSADNPYYRATLAHLLLLFSTLLDDTVFAEEAGLAVASLSDNKDARSSSPFRDHISLGSADDVALSPTASSSCKLFRRCHLCGAQLRQLLHRTGQEPNPVRDLSSLLELLAADDSSLKPLHDGMKGLVQILNESESKGSDEELLSGLAETQIISLPEPLSLSDLLSQRPIFHLLFGGQQSCDLSSLWRSRSSACQKVQETSVLAPAKDFAKDLKSVNLVDISYEFSPGLDLKEELTMRFGRRHADDPGTTMRHQKRRKGQPSIIQTGRNTKYVAPMRGRGFTIRGAGGTGGGSGPSLLGSGVCSGGGGMPSLLGSGHRPDIFRSRPQNTSRPPSLHVDDFNKLEKDDNPSEVCRRGSGGGSSLLSSAPLSGMGNLTPYRQPPRVLSTLPFVGAALAPTVTAAGPGGGILPAAAMATFLNWGSKPIPNGMQKVSKSMNFKIYLTTSSLNRHTEPCTHVEFLGSVIGLSAPDFILSEEARAIDIARLTSSRSDETQVWGLGPWLISVMTFPNV